MRGRGEGVCVRIVGVEMWEEAVAVAADAVGSLCAVSRVLPAAAAVAVLAQVHMLAAAQRPAMLGRASQTAAPACCTRTVCGLLLCCVCATCGPFLQVPTVTWTGAASVAVGCERGRGRSKGLFGG